MQTGEDKAWETLADLDPEDVCKRAGVQFNRESGLYTLKSFGMEFSIFPKAKSMSGTAAESSLLLGRLAYFFRLSVPWYLISAKEIPFTGRLVKPADLAGGQLFFRGSHILPLDKMAEKFGGNTVNFMKRGGELGGEPLDYGDASFRFYPLPRVPVIMILWGADEEFPARADLLFDSTCELHLPLDIIWSVAMMSILIML